ncbi:hypothetical protein HYX08_06050 [Candidatus Woesearchaeota archaeon]|nr:hypothetical protein [Candidatus Woesearchaeota archaeon]
MGNFTIDEATEQIREILDENVSIIRSSRPTPMLPELVLQTIKNYHLKMRVVENSRNGQTLDIYFRLKKAKGYGDDPGVVTPSQIWNFEWINALNDQAHEEIICASREKYKTKVKLVEGLRTAEVEKRDKLAEAVKANYGDESLQAAGLTFRQSVEDKFPLPRYKEPAKAKIPYHEGVLVKDGDEKFKTAYIEDSLIVNTYDLTTPHHIKVIWINHGHHPSFQVYLDNTAKTVRSKIPLIKMQRGVLSYGNFGSLGDICNTLSGSPDGVPPRVPSVLDEIRRENFQVYGTYSRPGPSFFYQTASGFHQFRSALKRVVESGKDFHRELKDPIPEPSIASLLTT